VALLATSFLKDVAQCLGGNEDQSGEDANS